MITTALNTMKKESGKTLEQISEESGIPKGTLNKLFAGQTADPKYSTLYTVVHSLGYTVDDIERLENPETKNSPTPAAAEAREVNADQIIKAFVDAGVMPGGMDLTDEDLRFLKVVFRAIADWFAQRDKGAK